MINKGYKFRLKGKQATVLEVFKNGQGGWRYYIKWKKQVWSIDESSIP